MPLANNCEQGLLEDKAFGVRTDLGTWYWRNEDISLAEQAFREAIKRDPGFGHACVNLGLLSHRAKDNINKAALSGNNSWQSIPGMKCRPEHANRCRIWGTG